VQVAVSGGPRFTSHHTEAEYSAFPLPRELDFPLRAMAGLPRDFLTHLRLACGASAAVPGSKTDMHPLSAKMQRLVQDLRRVMREGDTGDTGKSVVFSSHQRAIDHAGKVLADENIGCVRIVRGDSADDVRNAVTRWNRDPECRVFLCHIGAAAAGLTLTAARHCFLLEPCSVHGEEAQAMNRCHRIGQARQVEVTMYYCRNTVEERILAYRMSRGERILEEADGVDEADELSVLHDTAGARVSLHRLNYILGINDSHEE